VAALCTWLASAALALHALGACQGAAAQELTTYLEAAQARAPTNLEQVYRVSAQSAAQRSAELEFAPLLSATASYLRNGQAVTVTLADDDDPITIRPFDQFRIVARVDVPLLDMTRIAGLDLADAALEQAEAGLGATRAEVDLAVVSAWFELAGAKAAAEAARTGVEAALAHLDVVRHREAAGLASGLEVSRAAADLASAQQAGASTALQVALARRQLTTLTGLEPPGQIALPDDTGPEAPLEQWRASSAAPAWVETARADVRWAEAHADTAYWSLAPRVSAGFAERISNADFDPAASWVADVSLVWALPARTFSDADAARARARAAKARAAAAEQEAAGAVEDAWHRVEALRVHVEAGRARVEAGHAEVLAATQQWLAGRVPSLEVVSSQRDLRQASLELKQGLAQLALARALLRLHSGQPIAEGAP
jgi:cobalt-zinc-cadmium efflux system outer membrane protein